MDMGSVTWHQPAKRPAATGGAACLVHIYPTGTSMGTRYTLGAIPLVLGRGDDCDIKIADQSVSRRHARIEPRADGYYAIDLKSTNGTFVNDIQAANSLLHDGDYLRVGNCIYRFLAGGNVESQYHEEIYRLTIIDGLTEIHNKRYFLEFLERELVRSARHNRPLALVIFDIDHFKSINDKHGHLAGDYALREIAARLKGSVRGDELFARYGGEEFALVLVETDHQVAVQVAERVRVTVEKEPFEYEGKQFPVTISLGVASTDGNEVLQAQDLIQRSDARLYQAKREGRNRVVG